ncbi:FAD-dependent oxidoreductase [Maritimibacter sp. UBA3975]|uniref:NAD(P)/FAD-dependent oxidoreductase n=1 Tax=Maritimibacter sp. UBA3975 TaxID=1946833 RepID=UPI000C0AEC5A|nr:FAD-dependent oxidoreductase [Maritimibacter sp. UBA3975]MAM63117.1 glycerol-3-phosphate dehydrogenase [Maritimibacter sp.]|tara:strand:- start:3 stop:1067 length:1065 start_codon:yes stop_codon:yes gene_type:complete
MDDFLIIGGGIAGLTAGAHLAAHGTVTLLESEEALGYHASSRSAAIFIPTYGAPSVKALSLASAADLHDTGLTSPRGVMAVGRAGEEQQLAHVAADLSLAPIPLSDARALIPILDPEAITAAAYREEAWDIDTDALLQLYARRLRDNGQIVTRAPVTTIRHLDGWEVEAGGKTYRARTLVNAAGPWADVIAEMAGIPPIGITPLRRSMARIEVPGGADARDWPMVIGARENWYAKPDAGALIVSPSEEDPIDPMDAWAEDMVLAEGLMHFEEHITGEVTRMLANWAGLRTFSPDRQLVIGAEPGMSDFFWMAGQGGYGFQTAPAAGRLLAALATGQAPEVAGDIVTACDPARFR